MGTFVKGDVVVATFPFSDLSASKGRPALVVESFPKDPVIMCQITGQATNDSVAVSLTNADFKSGSLKTDSRIRPNYLFTAESSVIAYRAGVVSEAKMQEVVGKIIEIVSAA